MGSPRLWPVLLVLLVPRVLVAQGPVRVDPAISELLVPERRAGVQALPLLQLLQADDAPATGSLALDQDAGTIRLAILARITDPAGLAALIAAGAEIGSVENGMATARVPLAALDGLATAPGIAEIEAARNVRAVHDTSMRVIRADEIRTRVGSTWSGATGQGALVAIYDSGLDLAHHDFRDENGNSRVLAVWDQTQSGRPPPGFSYGYHCDAAAIQQRVSGGMLAACPMRDFVGHGTHVAGSAAGDGSAGIDPFRYPGVAPRAGLIIVKGGNNAFQESLIIDGLRWISQEAERLGLPVVVNLSLGGQFGAHDGSRLYEREIDALSGPGFMVVISSGNDGVNRNTVPAINGTLFHARGFATATQTVEFQLSLPAHTAHPDACDGNQTMMSLWYEGADRLRVEVVRPSGTALAVEPGQNQSSASPAGRISVNNGATGPHPVNGDYEAAIRIDGCGAGSSAPEAGTWRIRVTPTVAGSGQPFDMWIESSSHGMSEVVMAGLVGFDNRFVVGSPGNATRAVTVGAFLTRRCWSSLSGSICYSQVGEIGDLTYFSSGGPRRDGVQKPELTAPGAAITSALSADANIPGSSRTPDGAHMVLQGTSMSAPHVTGTVAAMYQVRPTLTPEEAKSALTVTATSDAFTTRIYGAGGGAPSDWWGAGKLNARDAFFAVSGQNPVVLALSSQPVVPEETILGSRGTRLPLLRLRLSSQGVEGIDVTSLGMELRGDDPEARVLLIRDADGDDVLDEDDPVIASRTVAVTPAGVTTNVALGAGDLRLPALSTVSIFLVIELSGAAPNGASFQATLLPDATEATGVDSGDDSTLNIASTSFASGPAYTTVLRAEETVSFSANPVRGERVIFNFIEAPSRAGIYTITGRLVKDLRTDLIAVRAEWDLRNEDGARVAPGVYLLVLVVSGEIHTEKLIVAGPGEAVLPQEWNP